jgi:hypothetical protein
LRSKPDEAQGDLHARLVLCSFARLLSMTTSFRLPRWSCLYLFLGDIAMEALTGDGLLFPSMHSKLVDVPPKSFSGQIMPGDTC